MNPIGLPSSINTTISTERKMSQCSISQEFAREHGHEESWQWHVDTRSHTHVQVPHGMGETCMAGTREGKRLPVHEWIEDQNQQYETIVCYWEAARDRLSARICALEKERGTTVRQVTKWKKKLM